MLNPYDYCCIVWGGLIFKLPMGGVILNPGTGLNDYGFGIDYEIHFNLYL